MNLADIVNFRLISQQIAGTTFKTAKDIVGWMGAMQAQDYAMVKWAVGVRLPGATDSTIENAINRGEIIRTHLLRPTWHLVTADDIYWMLALTAPRIKASVKSSHKRLELSETILLKSNTIIEKALRDGKHFTREALVAELGKAGIATDENRASHLLVWAELNGIICSGAMQGGKLTYALLEERVPKTRLLHKEEALAALAKKYFTGHCPAALDDFIWWSGLSAGDAKHALELVKSNFVAVTIDSRTYWLTHSYSTPKIDEESVHLLPAFDEFIISYKDRRASLPYENKKKAVSDNGIFRPIIVLNGLVIGIWTRTAKKDRVFVELDLFQPPGKISGDLIEKAVNLYGGFLGRKAEINDNSGWTGIRE